MKSGPIRPLHTLNWRWNLIVEAGTKGLFSDDGDWAAKTKIQAALGYALEMRNTGRACPENENLTPVEVRSMFIAAGPPSKTMPVVHGDEY